MVISVRSPKVIGSQTVLQGYDFWFFISLIHIPCFSLLFVICSWVPITCINLRNIFIWSRSILKMLFYFFFNFWISCVKSRIFRTEMCLKDTPRIGFFSFSTYIPNTIYKWGHFNILTNFKTYERSCSSTKKVTGRSCRENLETKEHARWRIIYQIV